MVDDLVDAVFDVLVRDFSAQAAELLGKRGSTPSQKDWARAALRSPVVDGKALLLTLKNPNEVLATDGKAAKAAVFGPAIELPLGGLGVRSIDYADKLHGYLIVAGPQDSKGVFKLYKWSPQTDAVPTALATSLDKGLRPEGLFALGDGKSFQLLSDDGDEKIGGTVCKEAPPDQRKFRSITVTL